MDFVVGLPKAPSRQDAIWVIVDRLTKSAHFLPIKITDSLEKLANLSPLYWDEIRERQLLGPELVQVMKEKIALIRKRMLTAQSRQKSYADKRRRELKSAVGDLVYLKVLPMRNVFHFGNKGKLNPSVHDVFHVSQLRKCIHDPSQVISHEPLDIQPTLTYEELPVQILDRKEQQLRTKTIPLVKVLWRNHRVEEASWELEQQMRDKYSHLIE
ncbi:uncharacterized protein LOC133852547 [Alnus glutinosa]|uniref:uncharacterized protein LOC133852547 n=1 Tax=Alnus glutinosa TaxID=3517 RepID=UPI002D77894F|nr:uncharacterized protein LOC133852547 [Alnus glutinosa]